MTKELCTLYWWFLVVFSDDCNGHFIGLGDDLRPRIVDGEMKFLVLYGVIKNHVDGDEPHFNGCLYHPSSERYLILGWEMTAIYAKATDRCMVWMLETERGRAELETILSYPFHKDG